MKDLLIFGMPALAIGLVLCSSANATILHVPEQYETIQAAVDAAVFGDEVWIGPQIYSDCTHVSGHGDTTRCCVVMKSGVKLRGSGMGQTIIDADSSGRGVHLYQCTDVEISHMTITGGYAELYGGAIFCRQSSPHIHNVEAVENWDGGFAMIENSNPTIERCLLHYNVAKSGGGLEIELSCNPYVYDCDILNNQAPFAAGIMLRGSTTLAYCRVSGNQTTGGETELGGGLLADDQATPTIIGCEFTNNTASGGGGGIALKGEGTGGLIEDCIISDNVCTGLEGRGGGIYVLDQAGPTIRCCVVSNNRASGLWSDGGGMFVHLSSLDMTNCTFHENYTDTQTGEAGNIGIQTSLYIPLTVAISHTIITESPQKGIDWIGTSNGPQVSCCDIYGNTGGDSPVGTGVNNFSLDPLICDAGGGNFHVQDGSPCGPGNHPDGPAACGGTLIGAKREGCDSGIDTPDLPRVAHLLGNRPNPFSNSTVISFVLDRERPVTLEVVDVSGRRVALLYDGLLGAGLREIAWDGHSQDGSRAESGVYFYRLRCGGLTQGLRMLRLQ